MITQHFCYSCYARSYISRGSNDSGCLLYTSDAADERSSVDLGGRRIIKKKNKVKNTDERII